MANFVYKKTETTSMKVVGILDADRMTIDVDGDKRVLLLYYLISMEAVWKSILKLRTKKN